MNLQEEYPDLLKMDNFDEAIIGVVERIGLEAICYDKDKVIEILMREMTEEEALDYFLINMIGSWGVELTPLILNLSDS